MSNQTSQSTPAPKAEKSGIFKRLVDKLDGKMKAKADAQSKKSSCCSDTKGGGKCC